MQYPPRRQVDSNGGEAWLDAVGQDLNEQLPNADRHIGYDMVHFDLDVQNSKS